MNNIKIEEQILAQLDRVMRLLKRRPAGKKHLGRGVFRILQTVKDHTGISTRALADRMELRPSSLNERLLRLEQDGYLTRERDPNDQRVFLVRLNPKGEDLLLEIMNERAERHASIAGILTDEEMMMMNQLMDKLATGLDALSEESACR